MAVDFSRETGAGGDGPRFSIIPGDFPDDPNATLVHYRVLTQLGRRTNRAGWCYIHQGKLADFIGVTRQTVNKAIGELVEWGYVEKRGQTQTKRNICYYRVVIDRNDAAAGPRRPSPDCGVDEAGDQLPDGAELQGDVSGTADRGVSAVPDTSVGSRADTTVGSRADTSINDPPINDPPLTTCSPAAGREREGGDFDLRFASGWSAEAQAEIQAIADNPVTADLVALLFTEVVGTQRPPAGVDAVAYVRQVKRALHGATPDEMTALAGWIVTSRYRDMPSTAEIGAQLAVIRRRSALPPRRASVPAAAPEMPSCRIVVRAGDPTWDAWLARIALSDGTTARDAAAAAGILRASTLSPLRASAYEIGGGA